jgi:hypothetical protein
LLDAKRQEEKMIEDRIDEKLKKSGGLMEFGGLCMYVLKAVEKVALLKFPNEWGGHDFFYVLYPEDVYWLEEPASIWLASNFNVLKFFDSIEAAENDFDEAVKIRGEKDSIYIDDINYFDEVYLWYDRWVPES